jgi:hypothetical protein
MHPRTHFVIRIKASESDIGTHALIFRWTSPSGQELWSSAGELNVESGPPGGLEVDLPVIAVLDLPFDSAGTYAMEVQVDEEVKTKVHLHVHAAPPMLPMRGGMVS